MSDLSEQKEQSLRILQLLCDQMTDKNACKPKLRQIINNIRDKGAPFPVEKNDWIALCKSIGLNSTDIRYRQLSSHFTNEEKKYFEQIKKINLRMRTK